LTLAPSEAASLRVALVGAGRVGTAAAHLLKEAGHSIVGVASRSALSAERAAARLGAPTFDLRSPVPRCEVVLIAVGDDAIRSVAAAVARSLSPGVVVCHTAGSLGTEPLRPVADVDGLPCALHPVASCPSVEAALRVLPGCTWGVTCRPELQDWARRLVRRDLGGRPVIVREEDRVLWHIAAVVAANGTAALMAAGERVLARIGIPEPGAALAPLCAGVVANAREAGLAGLALTGPVVRGEAETVVRHVDELRRRAPDLVEIYVMATRTILLAAQRAGRLDAAQGRALERALEDAWT
jgi:predicted short-subunit dehydrogenase-like oxidoreductase (DUF2520 family)